MGGNKTLLGKIKSLKFTPTLITVITNNTYIFWNHITAVEFHRWRWFHTVQIKVKASEATYSNIHPSIHFLSGFALQSGPHQSKFTSLLEKPSMLTPTCACLCTVGGSWSTCTERQTERPPPQTPKKALITVRPQWKPLHVIIKNMFPHAHAVSSKCHRDPADIILELALLKGDNMNMAPGLGGYSAYF